MGLFDTGFIYLTMIIAVTEIEGASRPFDFTIEPEALAIDLPGFQLTGDVQFKGEVARRAAQVEVKGAISADAEIECTRCLQLVAGTVAVDFQIGFVEPENFTSEAAHEVRADDLDVDVLETGKVDLKEIAREQILLNVPTQVFCRPDCKGLCPKCGGDRNLIDCACDDTGTDPRWAALENLRGSK